MENPPKVNRTIPYRAVPCSGKAPKVNWSKSEALSIGGVMEKKFQLSAGLNWKTDGGLKYLGVFLGEVDSTKNVL